MAQSQTNALSSSIGFEVTPLTQYKPFSGLVGHSVQRHFSRVSGESTSSFLGFALCIKLTAIGNLVEVYHFWMVLV